MLSPDGSVILYSSFSTKIYWSEQTQPGVWTEPQALDLGLSGPIASIDISADGRTLIIKRDDGGDHNLYWAQRSSTKDPWPVPEPLGPLVNSELAEYTGTISNDRRMLIFQRGTSAWDSQGVSGADLWMSLRPTMEDEWSEPVRLDNVNSINMEGKPRLLADGKTLLFCSDRQGGEGGRDIWQARLVLKEQLPEPDNGLPPWRDGRFCERCGTKF